MKRKIGVVALCALLLCSLFGMQTIAFAGSSTVQVATSSSFQGSINQGSWYVRGVECEDNSLVFGENSTRSTQIASKIKFENLKEYGFEESYRFEIDLQFTSISEGTKFLISFGMNRPTSSIGEAPATSIVFTANGTAIRCGLVSHGSPETELVAATDFSGNEFGKKISVSGAVKTDGAVTLSVNGTMVANEIAGFATEGYFGFGQTGNTVTRITKTEMTASDYSRPENTEAFTDFSGNEYNANEWYSQGMAGYFKPTSLALENEKLVFRNVAEANLSTLHSYSNFELTFDVPDIQRTAQYNEQTGELVSPVSSWIGVSMGAQSKNGGSGDGIANATVFYIDRALSADKKSATKTYGVLMSYNTVLKTLDFPENYHFWDEKLAETKGAVQLKVRMVDGLLTVWAKWETDPEYWQVLEYDLSYTPLGLIQIWGMGNNEAGGAAILQAGGNPLDIMAGNFSIDNVKLTNLDADKKVVKVDFVTNIRKKPADYDYVDSWSEKDLLSNILKEEN